jgi:hypothetical protein
MKTKRTPYWFKNLNKVKITSRKLLEKMERRAYSWQTCACGKQDSRIPRLNEPAGEPKDKYLRDLGWRFACVVGDMYNCFIPSKFEKFRKRALDIMTKIEKRATIVLSQELAKKKR